MARKSVKQHSAEQAHLPQWKQKALAFFPDLLPDLEEDASIYTVFFELLPRCHEAHKNGDIRFELPRIYEFAEWCYYTDREGEEDLGNAVGVAFYEHLVDEPEARQAIPQWLKPDIFETVSGLFEWSLGEAEYAKLRQQYAAFHTTTA